MKPTAPRWLTVAAVLIAPALGGAQPETARAHARGGDVYLAGPDVEVRQDVPADLVAAGGTVHVAAPVAESAIVAGGNVAIDGVVGDDVIAVGGDVVFRGHAGDDARLAGGTVRIAGPVDDDATAAGGTVRIEREGVIGGRAWLAGGEIAVEGTVGRQLRAAGHHVSIDGTVRGDVMVDSEFLDIGSNARIDGNVLHRGPLEPRIAAGAHVGGRVEHQARERRAAPRALVVLFRMFLVAALFVLGAVVIALFPRFTPAAAQNIRTDPWRSLGVGAAVLVVTPAVAFTVFVTGIGVPLALVLVAGYLVALLVAYLVAALFLGIAAAPPPGGAPTPSRGALALRLLVALVVLALVRIVPLLGGLITLAALPFGLGALALQLYRAYRGGAPSQPLPTTPAR